MKRVIEGCGFLQFRQYEMGPISCFMAFRQTMQLLYFIFSVMWVIKQLNKGISTRIQSISVRNLLFGT